MDHDTLAARADALRKMHHGKDILLLPNAWDAVSARLFAQEGFAAIATTSGGVAWALGYGDGQHAPFEETLAALRRITRVVDVPVTVDFESGYGATPADVGQSVRAVIDAGAAGINLEDGRPDHGPLWDTEQAAARLRAARAAANETGVPLVINARVDVWLHAGDDPRAPLQDAIARSRAYIAAGADCVYPLGLLDLDVIRDFVAAVAAPVNIMAIPATPPIAELKRIGVARLSTATAFTTLALGSVRRAARAIRATGTFGALDGGFDYMDAQSMFTGQQAG